jgi:hypothetical protein
MEKVGEAVCLVQHSFCRYFVHCNAARRARTFQRTACQSSVAFSEFRDRVRFCVVRWAAPLTIPDLTVQPRLGEFV